MHRDNVSRRGFIQMTATGAAVAGATSALMGVGDRVNASGANDRLQVAFLGTGGRCEAHLGAVLKMQRSGKKVEAAAVCDVFNRRREESADRIRQATGKRPMTTGDYRELIEAPNIDIVCIASPDHWHAQMTIDALQAGKDVYCEKPMTHSVEEAIRVVDAWNSTGRVMQVGVQGTSLPVWAKANELMRNGKLGKVVQYQTEYYRNSNVGQWRSYKLTRDMTPKNIDWAMFLGREWGLAPEVPFDRAVYAQWRRFWPFGSGMYTDLFVHRTTVMLKATGLRYPARVVGSGGIFLEYDGRDVPDVATVVADFEEGVQGIVTATMCSANTPIRHIIRGHQGAFVFGLSDQFSGIDFVAERPQVTLDSSIKDERIELGKISDQTQTHWENFVDAVLAGRPDQVNCPPDLGAAAIVTVNLGALSYREGKVFHFDPETHQVSEGNADWAKRWEAMSKQRAKPKHIAGWTAGDTGSRLVDPEYQALEGAWSDGLDPARTS